MPSPLETPNEAGPSTWRSSSPLTSPSPSRRLRPSTSGQTYAQIASRQLNEVLPSRTSVSVSVPSLDPPGTWVAEDVDRADHLDQLSTYEGMMAGHNWPVAPLPSSPPGGSGRSRGRIDVTDWPSSPPLGGWRDTMNDGDLATPERERRRRIAPMITLEDILDSSTNSPTSPTVPPPIASSTSTFSSVPISLSSSPTRRARPPSGPASDPWPSDPIAGDIRRIFGDLASLPNPTPSAFARPADAASARRVAAASTPRTDELERLMHGPDAASGLDDGNEMYTGSNTRRPPVSSPTIYPMQILARDTPSAPTAAASSASSGSTRNRDNASSAATANTAAASGIPYAPEPSPQSRSQSSTTIPRPHPMQTARRTGGPLSGQRGINRVERLETPLGTWVATYDTDLEQRSPGSDSVDGVTAREAPWRNYLRYRDVGLEADADGEGGYTRTSDPRFMARRQGPWVRAVSDAIESDGDGTIETRPADPHDRFRARRTGAVDGDDAVDDNAETGMEINAVSVQGEARRMRFRPRPPPVSRRGDQPERALDASVFIEHGDAAADEHDEDEDEDIDFDDSAHDVPFDIEADFGPPYPADTTTTMLDMLDRPSSTSARGNAALPVPVPITVQPSRADADRSPLYNGTEQGLPAGGAGRPGDDTRPTTFSVLNDMGNLIRGNMFQQMQGLAGLQARSRARVGAQTQAPPFTSATASGPTPGSAPAQAQVVSNLTRGGNNRRRISRRIGLDIGADVFDDTDRRDATQAGERIPVWLGGTIDPSHRRRRLSSRSDQGRGSAPTNATNASALPSQTGSETGSGNTRPAVPSPTVVRTIPDGTDDSGRHLFKAPSTRPRSRSISAGGPDIDGQRFKRRRIALIRTPGPGSNPTMEDPSVRAILTAGSETSGRPTYPKYTTLPLSVKLPSLFIMPSRTSHLALTSTQPPPSPSSASITAVPPSPFAAATSTGTPPPPRPLVSFTSHPPSTSSDSDACALHTSRPIPPGVGVYYFEITVLDSGPEGYMSLGFMKRGVNLRRLVGWEKGAWGWHADDGRAFEESGSGKEYGPIWGIGDTVGAGIDYTTRRAFFTKNGKLIGHTFRNLPTGLHPAVGLRNPKESVSVNLTGPFIYDIDAHVEAVFRTIMSGVRNHQVKEVVCMGATPQVPLGRTASLNMPLIEEVLLLTGSTTPATAISIKGKAETPSIGGENGDDESGSLSDSARPEIGPAGSSSPRPTAVIPSDSELLQPATKAVTALVLDYLSHTGMDRVKLLVLRDLAKRKMLEPAPSQPGSEPHSPSLGRRIAQVVEAVKRGDRVPWLEIDNLTDSASYQPSEYYPEGNQAVHRKLRILDLVAMLRPMLPRLRKDDDTVADFDEDVMAEGRRLLAASKLEQWTVQEKQWLGDACAILSETGQRGAGTDVRAELDGNNRIESMWVERRGLWSDELAITLREAHGLRQSPYLQQAITRHRQNIRALVNHGDGAAAFVDPELYLHNLPSSTTVKP